MQVKAVIHAAVESKRQGFDPQPEIMVPLVSIANELKSSTELVHATAKRELEALGTCVRAFMCLCVLMCLRSIELHMMNLPTYLRLRPPKRTHT